MKFTYSRLSSESIRAIIQLNYTISSTINCKYYVFGLHDNYLVESNGDKYIFRIYRNDWRTKDEILFELELLSYLDKSSASVAAPLLSNNSKLYVNIECPEGNRIAVLFNYAQGYSPGTEISLNQCELLGSSVATIHNETKNYKSQRIRPTINLEFLVGRSLTIIKPFLNNSQIKYLNNIHLKIQSNISYLNKENNDFGICVGDINPTNFHIDEKNIITHFDFDQCGYGYRVFEIGKLISSLNNHKKKEEKIKAFLKGYEKNCTLTEIEKTTIPYFEIASIIWVMSIHVSNLNKIGFQYLEPPFWSNRIAIIKALEKKLD